MVKQASKKAEQTAKDIFEGGGLGLGLPEIKINSNDIKERNKYFRFNSRIIKFYLLKAKQEE